MTNDVWMPGHPGGTDRFEFVKDSRMDNIVSFGPNRSRPRRLLDVPRSGAQILFFTGVRYCREQDGSLADVPEAHVIRDHQRRNADSGLALDLAAH